MTPYDVAKMIHRELSPIAPKLSAALNRALVDIGEGSMLVGLGLGTHKDDDVSFQELEQISTRGSDPANILSIISGALSKVEEHTSWSVLIDKKPASEPEKLDLLYTIYRSGKRF